MNYSCTVSFTVPLTVPAIFLASFPVFVRVSFPATVRVTIPDTVPYPNKLVYVPINVHVSRKCSCLYTLTGPVTSPRVLPGHVNVPDVVPGFDTAHVPVNVQFSVPIIDPVSEFRFMGFI